MDLSGCRFIYAGTPSELYGLRFVNCETSEYKRINGNTKSINLYNKKNKRNYFIEDDCSDSPISIDIEIATDSAEPINTQYLREIENWLFNRKGYYKLYIDPEDDCSGETYEVVDGETKQLYFNCRFVNPTKLNGNGGTVGFKATMECDSHLLWQDMISKEFEFNNSLETFNSNIYTFNSESAGSSVGNIEITIPPALNESGDGFIKRSGVVINRTGANLWGGSALKEAVIALGGTEDDTEGVVRISASRFASSPTLVSGCFKENTRYTVILHGRYSVASSRRSNIGVQYTDGTTTIINFDTAGEMSDAVYVSDAGKTIQRIYGSNYSGSVYFTYDKCGIFEGEIDVDNYSQYTGTTYSIDWSDTTETIYGGILKLPEGTLIKTYEYIESYNGEVLPREWISTKDSYNEGISPSIGASVVYRLSTPVTYQIGSGMIDSILGVNNVWADVGSITVQTSSPDAKTISVKVDSDTYDYIYPKVSFLMGAGGGDISVVNFSDDVGRFTSFKGLSAYIEFVMNSELNRISGDNYTKFYDKNFIRLVPGENVLNISGDIAKIKIEWQNRRYL